jgi:hypothetical protein
MVVEIILPAVVVEVAAIRVEELALAPAFTPRVAAAAVPEALRPRVVGPAVPVAFMQPGVVVPPLMLLLVPRLCTLLPPLAEQPMFRVLQAVQPTFRLLPVAQQPMFRRVPQLLVRRPSHVRR